MAYDMVIFCKIFCMPNLLQSQFLSKDLVVIKVAKSLIRFEKGLNLKALYFAKYRILKKSANCWIAL